MPEESREEAIRRYGELSDPDESDGPIVVENFAEACRDAETRMRQRLEQRFGAQGASPLEYHRPQHSVEVAEGVEACLRTIQKADPGLVAEKDISLGRLEGFAHDLVQNSKIMLQISGRNRPTLVRRRGATEADLTETDRAEGARGNEEASFQELIALLKRYQHQDGKNVFALGEKDVEVIWADIATTYPKPQFHGADEGEGNPAGLEISQPYLDAKTSVVGFALATEDLRGEHRIDRSTESFKRSGKAEFREISAFVKQYLHVRHGIGGMTAAEVAEVSQSALDWMKNQAGFVRWQKIHFEKSLAENEKIKQSPHSEAITKALRERYDNFDRNASEAERYATELKQRFGSLTGLAGEAPVTDEQRALFEGLLLEMGYEPKELQPAGR